jgi:regulator of sirC expression with transglutaminase-like and TPR domain
VNKAALLFSHLVRRPDAEIDLGAAALAIAAGEYPDLDIGHYLARLDELAAGLPATADAVVTRLFGELGLRGNETDYYDARNSFLSDVLDRRLGIPITLSVVFLEVSRRVGLGAAGVGFPGHFLVRVGDEVLDPFHGGVRRTLDGTHPSVGNRYILNRMLVNLGTIYHRRGDAPREENIAALIAALGETPRTEGMH